MLKFEFIIIPKFKKRTLICHLWRLLGTYLVIQKTGKYIEKTQAFPLCFLYQFYFSVAR